MHWTCSWEAETWDERRKEQSSYISAGQTLNTKGRPTYGLLSLKANDKVWPLLEKSLQPPAKVASLEKRTVSLLLSIYLLKPNTCRDDHSDAVIRWESGESGMWRQAGSGTGKVFSPLGRRAGNSQPSLQHRSPRLIPRAAMHLQETGDTSKHSPWKPKVSRRLPTDTVCFFPTLYSLC